MVLGAATTRAGLIRRLRRLRSFAVTNETSVIRVAEAFPALVRGLDPERADLARRHALATLEVLQPGTWRPPMSNHREPGHLGLLVLEGLLTREVVLGSTIATEIVGQGDLLRPADHDGENAPVPFAVQWTVLEPTRLAVLDRRFTAVIGHWPEAIEVVIRASMRRTHSLALHLAVCHLRRVDTRLLVLLWHLADRWGVVQPEGVHVPMRLTHQILGRLVGAQRPSVTTALKQLTDAGRLSRLEDGGWLLRGDPPDELERLRDTAPDANVA
jgi:CRP/FNR family transcriptional regulator, cyclic AMP receptor protein